MNNDTLNVGDVIAYHDAIVATVYKVDRYSAWVVQIFLDRDVRNVHVGGAGSRDFNQWGSWSRL